MKAASTLFCVVRYDDPSRRSPLEATRQLVSAWILLEIKDAGRSEVQLWVLAGAGIGLLLVGPRTKMN